ncbi:MAG TPA: radical SAM protein [Veillonellaceae bacterium]|uniref:radical SAM protein n=1 Tax=Dialister hominis TaxID=2582419 RepID=UPI003521026B|nr:radical SAM protein [Veillonellaceae bacterium]
MEKLTIYLGSRCNLKCAYCHRVADTEEPSISESLLRYIRKKKALSIRFIGGEPTLYMDEIQKVVDAAPGASFSITTNGVLFEKYRDYFLKHHFHVCLSFDGSQESLRGYDPFQKVLDYPWVAVSCTLYHGNTDFTQILQSFAAKEKIIGRSLSFFPHIMHVTSKENAAFALTREDFRNIARQWEDCVAELVEGYEKQGIINDRYMGLFWSLYQREQAKYRFGETYCVNHRVKKCDASGRFFTCLYLRNQVLPAVSPIRRQKRIMEAKFPHCWHCLVYPYCGGACIKSRQHELECYFYKRLYTWWLSFCKAHRKAIDELGGTI